MALSGHPKMSMFSHVYKTYTFSDPLLFKKCAQQIFSKPKMLKVHTNHIFLQQIPILPECVCFIH